MNATRINEMRKSITHVINRNLFRNKTAFHSKTLKVVILEKFTLVTNS